MRTVGLSTSASVVLNGSGNGTAQLGPRFPGEVWAPAVVSVSVTTNTNEANCKIYAGGSVTQQNFIDGTLSGSTGDSTDRLNNNVFPGMFIFAVWAGGDAGSTATVTVTGSRTVP